MRNEKITHAFKLLRKLGYFARQNFQCCQSCAWSAIPDEKSEKAVFYHRQDGQDLERRGECYLSWSGNGYEIVSVLTQADLKCEWNGDPSTRIKIIGLDY